MGFCVHAPGESFTLSASGTSEPAGEGPSRTCAGFNPVGTGTTWPHSGHKMELPPALHLIFHLSTIGICFNCVIYSQHFHQQESLSHEDGGCDAALTSHGAPSICLLDNKEE